MGLGPPRRTPTWLERVTNRIQNDASVLCVHSPELTVEEVKDSVAQNAARLGVKYPVALDDDVRTW